MNAVTVLLLGSIIFIFFGIGFVEFLFSNRKAGNRSMLVVVGSITYIWLSCLWEQNVVTANDFCTALFSPIITYGIIYMVFDWVFTKDKKVA